MKAKLILALLFLFTVSISAKKKTEITAEYNYGTNNKGTTISIHFEKGKEHNHPLFAIWLADENGKYIQTLYVSESVGHGIFVRANRTSGKWMGGEIQRCATLPFWAHQRGVKNQYGTFMPTPKQPVVDAYTGATPSSSFVLKAKTENLLAGKYKVMLEVNQSWDWNEYWTNDLYPDNKEYKTSSQPALVYAVDIDTNKRSSNNVMTPIGHSHYAGANGSLTSDYSTLTTALKIAKKITVTVE